MTLTGAIFALTIKRQPSLYLYRVHMTIFLRLRWMVLASLFAGLPVKVLAWGSLLLIEAPPQVATFSAGASLWSLPQYPGGKRQQNIVLPALDYYGTQGIFASTDTGVGWNMSRRKDLQAGLRLWPMAGRHGADRLAGLSSLPWRIQQQAFVNVQALPALLLQGAVLHGSGAHADGAQVEIGATSGLPLGADLLAIGVAASAANGAHRQSYFGVSAADALATGLPAFKVPAGWQDVSLTLSFEHRFSPGIHLDAQLIAARIIGAASRSPIVTDKRQLGVSTTLWFDW